MNRLSDVMERFPTLSHFGMGVFDQGRKTRAQVAVELASDREKLVESIEDVGWTIAWLEANVLPIATVSRHRRSSYRLKHIAEKFHPQGYISNGVLIAAALIVGYPYYWDGGPNVNFGMSERSLKALSRLAFR